MDSSDKLSRAIDGTMYLPGIVGLNNIKANDYCNVILQVSFFTSFLPPLFSFQKLCIFTDGTETFHGHVMVELVSCWPLTAEARVHSWARPRGMFGGRNDTGTGFSLNTFVFFLLVSFCWYS
jgi:hypothetical protein